MLSVQRLYVSFSLSAVLLGGGVALAEPVKPIKIGELNSYKAQAAFLEPYRKAMELAVEQINAGGGVLGRPLQLVIRDDNGNPSDAVLVAEDLWAREQVDVLTGTFLSHIGLAVADLAAHKKRFFLASEPLTNKLVWDDANPYTFRLRTSTYMQVAMLIPEAVKLNKKRWAIVYPNYEYGQSAVNTFKSMLQQAQPDVEFVVEQATPLGKIDAGSVVNALAEAKPEAMFNVLFATDLLRFVRAGNQRRFFDGLPVVSMLTGEPEYLDPLRKEAPQDWVVTGYPWYAIDTPEHQAFLQAYQDKYKDHPRLGSIIGYATIQSLAAGITKAGSTEDAALIEAFKGLELSTPFGPIQYRESDHQSTMGAYLGRLQDGKMVDIRYIDGASVQPSDEQVLQWRK
ncbi:ABC transporter substrate-binding protein [Alcaligenes endophyticus]|uniref:ABC transporter substrate-binding protein n=1 Tax=Alcaligenes endophyticus TaxID=1929088 RepID=A0ABT8EMY0_9BURK|nr:ABC transporter substrate-binding protein [Alcaligenes endophyticus]MCX5591468.1 ABC transporter substrate-binding protein [Alcaligenes endophyticus]MDN4122651.1 ABC transporter substrate-binding protein [Alcaligenes endophyticus]